MLMTTKACVQPRPRKFLQTVGQGLFCSPLTNFLSATEEEEEEEEEEKEKK